MTEQTCDTDSSRIDALSSYEDAQHDFVGRLDRDCEVCGRPDRHGWHDRRRENLPGVVTASEAPTMADQTRVPTNTETREKLTDLAELCEGRGRLHVTHFEDAEWVIAVEWGWTWDDPEMPGGAVAGSGTTLSEAVSQTWERAVIPDNGGTK